VFCSIYASKREVKINVKCTLVQALRLCTGCTAHRGSTGIDLLVLDHGTRRGEGSAVTPWPLFTLGKTCTGGWVGLNIGLDRIRSPDRPARRYTDCAA
jgi:hypothetical protein